MPNPPNPSSSRPLILGEDYYIENGAWVFTAAYHLKRGSCCDNGCRHCPYPHQGDDIPQRSRDVLSKESL